MERPNHLAFYSINGFWGGPFLRDVFGYTKEESGRVLMGISIGVSAGCLTIPTISDVVRSRKWVIFAGTCLGIGVSVVLIVATKKLNEWWLFALFLMFAYVTNSQSMILHALVREYYASAVA